MLKEVDVILFMGQSNMAGRGKTCERWPQTAPASIPGAGYEYRAVSAPGRLFPVEEPFGAAENRELGIDDKDLKSGSMVTSFINAYYTMTGVPVVGISASKGGSSILQWQPGGAFLEDTLERWRSAVSWLREQGIHIRRQYMAWCQGETDGDHGMNGGTYRQLFENMLSVMIQGGIEKCFLISIGCYNGDGDADYEELRQEQVLIAKEDSRVELVSDEWKTMKSRGLMRDPFHYYQAAYNEVGLLAGIRAGRYATVS